MRHLRMIVLPVAFVAGLSIAGCTQTGQQTLAGGAVGAAGGALVGAIAGNAGLGAAIGGGVGLAGGYLSSKYRVVPK